MWGGGRGVGARNWTGAFCMEIYKLLTSSGFISNAVPLILAHTAFMYCINKQRLTPTREVNKKHPYILTIFFHVTITDKITLALPHLVAMEACVHMSHCVSTGYLRIWENGIFSRRIQYVLTFVCMQPVSPN